MTNKEALENIMIIACKLGTGTTYEEDEMLDNCKKIVLKDLEVLEILKGNAKLYVSNINKEVKYIQISITTCDNRFDKVEEWLNEKKE